jgi:hypothetical protein
MIDLEAILTNIPGTRPRIRLLFPRVHQMEDTEICSNRGTPKRRRR